MNKKMSFTKNNRNNKEQSFKTVVVLGMGRGGTSMIAGMLNILGVKMGDRLKPVSISNPKGYFEDQDFIKLNKAIFDSAEKGSNYWNPPSYEQILAQKNKFDHQIKSLILRKEKSGEIWGWKMPWTNLTIELFLPYLANPHFVVVFRNPVAIADSFMKNDGADDFFYTLNLVNDYNKVILNFLGRHQRLPRVFISFEDTISNPIEETKRLADFLDLKLTKSKTKKIQSFVIPRGKMGREKMKVLLNFLLRTKLGR